MLPVRFSPNLPMNPSSPLKTIYSKASMQRIGSVPFELPPHLQHWVTLSESEITDLLRFYSSSIPSSSNYTEDDRIETARFLQWINTIPTKECNLLELNPRQIVGNMSYKLRILWLNDLEKITPRITSDNAIISESKQKILILIKLMCGRKIVDDDIIFENFDLTPLVEYIHILKRLKNTHNGTEQEYKTPTNVDEMRTQLIELLNSINK
jgi:hypothetical protein